MHFSSGVLPCTLSSPDKPHLSQSTKTPSTLTCQFVMLSGRRGRLGTWITVPHLSSGWRRRRERKGGDGGRGGRDYWHNVLPTAAHLGYPCASQRRGKVLVVWGQFHWHLSTAKWSCWSSPCNKLPFKATILQWWKRTHTHTHNTNTHKDRILCITTINVIRIMFSFVFYHYHHLHQLLSISQTSHN